MQKTELTQARLMELMEYDPSSATPGVRVEVWPAMQRLPIMQGEPA